MDAMKLMTEGMIKENRPAFNVGDTVPVSYTHLVFSISSIVTFLLITSRRRCVPASGAKVRPLLRTREVFSTRDCEKLSMRRLGTVSYTHLVERNCVSTSFRFEAHTRRPTGRPICFAYQPARISPKLPVGTQKSTATPSGTFPACTSCA